MGRRREAGAGDPGLGSGTRVRGVPDEELLTKISTTMRPSEE
ncbi:MULTISPECIES: hypothetical protein [unclassified Streptomyces]|nr:MULTISPECIES: hypothetical protein [unclassified Streptomyces]